MQRTSPSFLKRFCPGEERVHEQGDRQKKPPTPTQSYGLAPTVAGTSSPDRFGIKLPVTQQERDPSIDPEF